MERGRITGSIGEFLTRAIPPAEARRRAARAIFDTVGVTLAGAVEPAARIAQEIADHEGSGSCSVLGTRRRTGPGNAALANGTAAHALDYDDMCFVSLAHPSATLVPAILSAGELVGACGSVLLDAYVVGFELEARLGALMNPRHYRRGWHCTSTLGTLGAAAAAARILQLAPVAAGHAVGIAASAASGLKENFGTMVKPLHAGLAASHGVLAALLARGGMAASDRALDGPQGFLRAMDSERLDLGQALADLGSRWEIIDSGITIKLYPSCAGTHPALDALLELKRVHRFGGDEADNIDRIDVDVDSITPTILIHDRPLTGLEAKFSMPFCVAAASLDGSVGIATFSDQRMADPRIALLLPRISMRVDPALDGVAQPLTQARVHVHLRDGRALVQAANGARGYPERPLSNGELIAKFTDCALRSLSETIVDEVLSLIADPEAFETLLDLRSLTALLGA